MQAGGMCHRGVLPSCLHCSARKKCLYIGSTVKHKQSSTMGFFSRQDGVH